MKLGGQIGALLCGVALSAALVWPSAAAQYGNQASRPAPRPSTQRGDRPPQGANRQPNARQRNDRPPAYQRRNGTGQNRGPRNENRPNGTGAGNNPNRPPGNQYRQPAQNSQERAHNMTPAERQRLAPLEQQFQHLPQQKQQELRDSARVWQRMTPEQRDHIKNDILPKWKQMPPQRQAAIHHRLAVLQNMPEDARNRHLNDPSFTRGMSDEDKQMLRDLAHQHVGGSPEPPSE